MMQFHFSPSDFTDRNKWAVYSHSLPGPTGWHPPAWIGYCRAGDLLCSPDAYQSQAWRDTVHSKPLVRCDVHSWHLTDLEAMRALAGLVKLHRPPANLATRAIGAQGDSRILCVTTGVEYENQAAVCREFGFYESQFSVYMNRRDRGRIRGLEFRRI